MQHWTEEAIFYHIYPLGCFGAPERNDLTSPPVGRILELKQWIAHLKRMHFNTLYLGPVFESSVHGYDTIDLYQVDRRLGTNQQLQEMIDLLHENGIRVVLDAVFNHVGRDFFAFRDLQTNGQGSPFASWFSNLNFQVRSPYNDDFAYEAWDGHFDLVKLDLSNPDVREYLFKAVDFWMDTFHIDGLRIDAADHLKMTFLQELHTHCKVRDPQFWLKGEVVYGDYSRWINAHALDSSTNYEIFKGLYSSHNDHNYFEIAYSLNRQFGEYGVYRNFLPYNFADNHDVNRLTSNLNDSQHVYPLYCLLFTMPGIPSIYYGSEWGITGKRDSNGDKALRPRLEPDNIQSGPQYADLPDYISRLSKIRQNSHALQKGIYRQLLVQPQQFAFMREYEDEQIIVALNSSDQSTELQIPLKEIRGKEIKDLLQAGNEQYRIDDNSLRITSHPKSGIILQINC